MTFLRLLSFFFLFLTFSTPSYAARPILRPTPNVAPTYSIRSVTLPVLQSAFLYDGPSIFGRVSSGQWARISSSGHIEWEVLSTANDSALVFFNRLFLFGNDSQLRCFDAVLGYELWRFPGKFVRLFSSYPYVVGQTSSGKFVPIRFDTGISEALPNDMLGTIVLNAPMDSSGSRQETLLKIPSLAPPSAFSLRSQESFVELLMLSPRRFAVLSTHRLFLLAKPAPIL